MKLAFSAPSSDDVQRRRQFDHLRTFGYDGVQLKPGDYKDYLDKADQFFADYPQVRGMISGCIAYGKLDEAGQAHLRKTMRFAKAVGADLIIFCHGILRNGLSQADLESIGATLERLGGESLQQGVQFTLHHHFNQPCMDRADFDIFFDRAKQQSYGLTIDTAHLVKSNINDVAEIIRTYAHAIHNFHMKDFAGGEFKVLGEGAIDFAPIFQAIKDIGYEGWISADEESGGDVVDGMRSCANFLRKGLDLPRRASS